MFQRFLALREHKHNFAVVREAEQGKIALSQQANYGFDLGFIEPGLLPSCTAETYAEVAELLLSKIAALIVEATQQAGTKPDIIYITGGSAKSPLIRHLIRELFGDSVEIVDGDHFGSVAAGLGVWAERVFR